MQLQHSFPQQTRLAASTRTSRLVILHASQPASQHISLQQALPPQQKESEVVAVSNRRAVGLFGLSILALAASTDPASANVFAKEKKRKLTPADYTFNEDVDLSIFEVEEGRYGEPVKLGDRVVVHYDCMFMGIDVVSSRSARLLGGNRTIQEPYEFVAGQPVMGQAAAKINDRAGGLFAGSGGPRPPPALSRAVLGMRKGGKRSIIVDKVELGYPRGQQEIPKGGTFELKVQVLDVNAPPAFGSKGGSQPR